VWCVGQALCRIQARQLAGPSTMSRHEKEKDKSPSKPKSKKADLGSLGAFVSGYAVGCVVCTMLQLDEIISVKGAQVARAIQMQSCVRRYLQYRTYISTMKVWWQLRAAIMIQSAWRRYDARMVYVFEREKRNVMRQMQQVHFNSWLFIVFLSYPSSIFLLLGENSSDARHH
jgi:hypothetical protein